MCAVEEAQKGDIMYGAEQHTVIMIMSMRVSEHMRVRHAYDGCDAGRQKWLTNQHESWQMHAQKC